MIAEYLQGFKVKDQISEWSSSETAPGNDVLRVKSVKIASDGNQTEGLISMQDAVNIETEFWSITPGRTVHIAYHLLNEQGVVVLTTGSNSTKYEAGVFRSSFQIPGGLLNSGVYHLKLLIVENGARVTYTNNGIASFNVVDLSSRSGGYMGKEPGVVQPFLAWQTESLSTT
jgi:lipopolysaccharide transport system ATP-binding protein